MSRTAKIVLSVVAVLVVLIAGLGFAAWRFISGNFTTDPTNVAAIGQEIVPHELPPGYEGEFGTDLLGFKVMMAFDQQNTQATIMLMSVPAATGRAELERSAREQLSQQRGTNVQFEYVGTRDIVVGGSPVGLDRYGGVSDGVSVVQEIAVFEGPGSDLVLLMLVTAETVYDASGFEAFLASLE